MITSRITTHVLDTSTGGPAAGIALELLRRTPAAGWETLATGSTDADGRASLLQTAGPLTTGVYALRFATGAYFERQGVVTFYPTVTVEFAVASAAEHYHVPLLLSPFGYSTYRGS